MRQLIAVIPVALQRLRSHPGLTLAALAALTLAVGLVVSVPVYGDAASLRVLREELARRERQSGRPALAMLLRYLSSAGGALEWEPVAAADAALRNDGLERIGLPLAGLGRHARTADLPTAIEVGGQPQLDLAIGFVSGLEGQIRLLDGAAPAPATDLDAPLEAMITRALADRAGLNVGDELMAVASSGGRPVRLILRISGIWEAVDSADPAWFYQPASFDELLLVDEASFGGPLAAAIDDEVAQALWFARYDGADLSAASAGPLLERVEGLRAFASTALPGTRLEQSPDSALGRYRGEAAALSLRLLVFSAPALGLMLGFAALVAGQMAERRRAEVALLKTRGASDGQILGLALAEWLLLGGLALALGAPLGLAFAGLMARTSSFLQLDPGLPELDLALAPGHLLAGLGAVCAALIAALAPAASAARATLADAQRQIARPRDPLWQRAYLDLILLPVPLYGIYQLRAGSPSELSADPLLVLVPALLSLNLGLIALRLLPGLLSVAARLAARPAWVAPLMALRGLARQPEQSRGPLLILALTLSLATFSAAAAATLDADLRRGVEYEIGAASQLIETGESTEDDSDGDGLPDRRDISEGPRFLFVPASEHLEVPGVRAASRVGRYDARLSLGGGPREAQLIGVDRLSLPEVLRGWNPDWADGASLGELMNRLAAEPAGALVSRELLGRGLRIGQSFTVRAELFGDIGQIELVAVGAVDLFPGLYPQDGALVIANLDHIFDQMGGQYPYDVWIDREEGADIEQIAAGVRRLGIDLVDVRDAASRVREEQARPQRQGLFGLLSIGYLAASGISVAGFLIAALASARRRSIELGVLRALGLPGRSLALALAIEQLVVVGAGLVLGLGLGLLNTLLVVPELRVGVGPYPGTPPAPASLAWAEMGLAAAAVALALLVALAALGLALSRMRLFIAVKLGDAS